MNAVQTAIAAIRNMTNDELNQTVEAIRLARTYLARSKTRNMMIGDTVWFDAKTRGVVTGVVTKINLKTVGVKCNRTGSNWKVATSLIQQPLAA